jgi:hypothetical protein
MNRRAQRHDRIFRQPAVVTTRYDRKNDQQWPGTPTALTLNGD